MKVKIWLYNNGDQDSIIYDNVKGLLLTLTGDLVLTFNNPIEKIYKRGEYNGFYVLD